MLTVAGGEREVLVDSDPANGVTTDPCYFGPEGAPRFGWFHSPIQEWSGARVVLCAPVGYEGLFAHPSYRLLANTLAQNSGAVVLRFDYYGAGDSAGTDEAPGVVDEWVRSIQYALEEIKSRYPSDGPIVVIGMRVGALLAIEALRGNEQVDGLVLWAPAASGKAFVREQKAFSRAAHATYTDVEVDISGWGAGAFEAAGSVFTGDTVDALRAMSFDDVDASLAQRVLVLERDDIPGHPEWYDEWRDRGIQVEYEIGHGYADLMQPPISMKLPYRAIERIDRWLRDSLWPSARPFAPSVPSRDVAQVGEGVVEQAVWYDGRPGSRFGILTLPEGRRPSHAFLVLNNAHGNRTGPAGMYTWVARRIAVECGAATLRIDLAGLGDSTLPSSRPEHHSYALDPVEDVVEALHFLAGLGLDEVYLGGLCSGAYLAWHAALVGPHTPSGLILINQQTFQWNEGDSLDVDPLTAQREGDYYAQSARSLGKWMKLLRGEVEVGYAIRALLGGVRVRVDAWWQDARAKMPAAMSKSGLPQEIRNLQSKGVSLHFLFSGRDPGITNLNRELGGHKKHFVSQSGIDIQVIEGPDHSFTPRWARWALTDSLTSILSPRESTDLR